MTFADSARSSGYEISAPPKGGGTGAVYRATELATGKEVAIKALAIGIEIDRVKGDAVALAAVDHPNMANLRGVETIDGTACLVTDWVDGHALSDFVGRNREMSARRAIHIFEQVADAVEAAHRIKVVHRDINPSNIIIGADDRVTVIDFGLSRGLDTTTVSAQGVVDGTPRYMAPEVIEGEEPSEKSDQYSLAIMLHEMLTGTWPFPESEAVAGALHHQLHSTPKPVDEINPLLGAGLSDALLHAMAKSPSDRFPSLGGFVSAVSDPESKTLRKRRASLSGRPLVVILVPVLLAAALAILLALFLRANSDEMNNESGAGFTTTQAVLHSGHERTGAHRRRRDRGADPGPDLSRGRH